MKKIFSTIVLVAAFITTASAQKSIVEVPCNADQTIRVWDNAKAPHSNEETDNESRDKSGHFVNTSETVFYLYKAENNTTGQSVVVLPGGGYSKIFIEREGFKLAEQFQKLGITALVVKYRLPNNGHKEVPLEDAQEALRYLRKNAKKLGLDPAKVGVAGSHLAAHTSVFTADEEKPAFTVLFNPVISTSSCMTHQNTFRQMLGKGHSAHEREYYSLENRVTATTPPTLIFHTSDDRAVPPINSVLYYKALNHYGVKASLFIYPEGGHTWLGNDEFRYDKEWKHELKKWLEYINK